MTDAEIIATWMEPRPTKCIFDITRDNDPAPGRWWNDAHPASAEWRPRHLDLDALWEVEERLTDEQWGEYRGWFMVQHAMDGHRIPFGTYLLHATPAQKIAALAAVLRPIVENSAEVKG